MSNPNDHDLDQWLSHYTLSSPLRDFTDRMVAMAGAIPQKTYAPSYLASLWNVMMGGAPTRLSIGILCLTVMIGFSIGIVNTTPLTQEQTLVAESIHTSDNQDMNTLLYGPTTWQEVRL